jgi:PII-like signaling protein
MEGTFLRFYVEERQTHHGVLLWEWLLQKANAMGIGGGSAFRAIGGFGRHHAVHEDRFFELAGTTGVEVEFIVSDDEAKQVLALIREEKIRILYARIPAHFAVINPDKDDPVSLAADA